MSKSYIEPWNPADIESGFSTEDVLSPLPEGLDEEYREKHLKRIKQVMDRLPDRESDLVDLYFFKRKKQTDIADVFGITQAAVSYRLQRAMQRIRFLVEMPDADKHDVYEDLREWRILDSELDAKIFSEMYESTCQSEVAERLDLTQGRVRHRFLSNLSTMGETLIERYILLVEDRFSDGTLEREELLEMLDGLRRKRNRGDFEEEEDFEDAVLAACETVIETVDEEMAQLHRMYEYYRTFKTIRYNFNILREIKLPRWSNRSTHVIA